MIRTSRATPEFLNLPWTSPDVLSVSPDPRNPPESLLRAPEARVGHMRGFLGRAWSVPTLTQSATGTASAPITARTTSIYSKDPNNRPPPDEPSPRPDPTPVSAAIWNFSPRGALGYPRGAKPPWHPRSYWRRSGDSYTDGESSY